MPVKKKVVYAFIDATNIIYGAGDHGWRMDFKKLIRYLKGRYKANKIFYFAGVDNENLKQLKFYEKLQEFGYTLRTVPVKTFADGRKKADIDSRMTFEMMLYFKEYSDTIVMSGDGDFYWVLEYLLLKKSSVKLIAPRQNTARELKQLFGNEFTDLSRLKEALKFKKNAADAFKGSTARDYGYNISRKSLKVKVK